MLAEPARLRLLALAAEEELTIGELAELVGESQPNVSRHVAPLRQAGLVNVRRQGTRALVSLAPAATVDAVVADALASGRALCEADGSLARLHDIVRARDVAVRDYFATAGSSELSGVEGAVLAYAAALACLLPDRRLAVDVGTGDGAFLDLLAPVFDHVLAIDRSAARLSLARERAARRGYANVTFLETDVCDAAFRKAVGGGASAVFAARILHHAAKPAALVAELASALRPASGSDVGGSLVVVDYAQHADEGMRDQADQWLGFGEGELVAHAEAAGLADARVVRLPPALCGSGPDAHLPWLALIARKSTHHPRASSVHSIRSES